MGQSKSKKKYSLKDDLFNQNRVEYLATLLTRAIPKFQGKRFTGEVMDSLLKLELKERIQHIAIVLERHLDKNFQLAAKGICSALPPPLDPKRSDNDFGDFIFAPLGEYVVRNGLTKKHLSTSLRTLYEITQRFSMEDAIRSFIVHYPDETFKKLTQWSTDKNYHVRRLVSEGTRPLLPWSRRIGTDIERPLPLLATLHSDRTRYVTRSVANHLNDIAKTNPDLVIATLKSWRSLGVQDEKELEWMSRHALRTLTKSGNRQALSFFGFKSNPKIAVTQFKVAKKSLQLGEPLEFSFKVRATEKVRLLVDYTIEFRKASGKLAGKNYKITTLELGPGESKNISKTHPLRQDATTYKLYPGKQRVILRINGHSIAESDFTLI